MASLTANEPASIKYKEFDATTDAQEFSASTSENKTNTKKKNLYTIAGIVLLVVGIIIGTVIVILITSSPNDESDPVIGGRGYYNGSSYWEWENFTNNDPYHLVCGINAELGLNNTLNDCLDACHTESEFQVFAYYYVDDESSTKCLCDSNITQFKYYVNTQTFNRTAYEEENDDQTCYIYNNSVIVYYGFQNIIAIGRPYIVEDKLLLANLQTVTCDEESNDYTIKANSTCPFVYDESVRNDLSLIWYESGLHEHASIASFSRFSLQLMVIDAPLSLIESSHEAALDEVKHSQISFFLANCFAKSDNSNKCFAKMPYKFPEHSLNIKNDWNYVFQSTIKEGCLGELLSALKAARSYYIVHHSADKISHDYTWNLLQTYYEKIARDELKHAMLAWNTITWMLSFPIVDENSNKLSNIDINNQVWWEENLKHLNLIIKKNYHSSKSDNGDQDSSIQTDPEILRNYGILTKQDEEDLNNLIYTQIIPMLVEKLLEGSLSDLTIRNILNIFFDQVLNGHTNVVKHSF